MKHFLSILFILCSVFTKADFWTQKANYLGGGLDGALSFSIGNKGYIACGRDDASILKNDFWEYDPLLNSWTQKANFGGSPRFIGTGFSIGNKGYAGLGTGSAGLLQDFWEYNPVSNSWVQKADFAGGARSFTVGFSINNMGYIGTGSGNSGGTNDLWQYDPISNVWIQKNSLPGTPRYASNCFVIGTNAYIIAGYTGGNTLSELWEYNSILDNWSQKTNFPAGNRCNGCAFTICDLGYFGLGEGPNIGTLHNDLWQYDPVTNTWLQKANFSGQPRDEAAFFSAGNYGYLGIGGNDIDPLYTDFWEYTPDSCVSVLPNASFIAPNAICPGTCSSFLNLSANAATYQWSFPGASPTTSTNVNPQNICYSTSGTYDVQLIATNANGSDTLLLTNYITVYPAPPPQSIIQNGDTLFAIAGAASYQWYFDGSIISGATDYFYVAIASGDYNMVATDTNGCEVEAVINNVLTGLTLPLFKGEGVTAFPNPVSETIYIRGLETNTADEVSIYNVVGEKVFSAVHCKVPIGNCQLSSGMYYIEISTNNKIFRSKFLKQ
jgi:N-acetylneuraminic acid mutarotase